MEPKRGVCELLKASMHIVVHSFWQFLPPLPLLSYVMAVFVVPLYAFTSLQLTLALYLLYCTPYPSPSPSPNLSPNSTPDPDPNPNLSPNCSFPCRLSIRVMVCLFIILTDVFVNRPAMAPAMVFGLFCGGLVIFLLLELMVGFVYTALTLRSLVTFCRPIVEESRACVQAMERWSFSLVRSWKWVAGFAMVLMLFLELLLALGVISLDSRIFSQVWAWINACASVGLPALLFLYIRVTQVTLYLACKTYHTESKESLITHT